MTCPGCAGDLPEYGSWSQRSGPFLGNGFQVRVIHCFWTFESIDDATDFLAAAFGEAGRRSRAMTRPRLSYNVAVYHRDIGTEPDGPRTSALADAMSGGVSPGLVILAIALIGSLAYARTRSPSATPRRSRCFASGAVVLGDRVRAPSPLYAARDLAGRRRGAGGRALGSRSSAAIAAIIGCRPASPLR